MTYTLPGGHDEDMYASNFAGMYGFSQVLLVPYLQ